MAVAPFTGAWIEMMHEVCGTRPRQVAPFTGAWIEIRRGGIVPRFDLVAPFTGAWIEIEHQTRGRAGSGSLPSRERGLKLRRPPVGGQPARRSLHGSVD